ncbi:MAG: HDIG domain-containing protein [Bacteroidales bacterium]|nr:MAG: HDIG domain-containing protein [Bacteroidales bacterium]
MRKIFRFFQIYYRGILRSLYFLIAIIVIVFFLPRQGKFKYEFQKGKPWMHEDLIAPFDFPIYKTEAELFEERNFILKDFKPYFNFDETVLNTALTQFQSDFSKEWSTFQIRTLNRDQKVLQSSLNTNQGFASLKLKYETLIKKDIRFIYEKGVIDASDLLTISSQPSLSVTLLVDSKAVDTEIGEVFTMPKAIEHIQQKILQEAEKDDPLVLQFWQSFSFQRIINPNLLFDEKTTEKVKRDILTNVSLTKGMVQAGEHVISRNEVIKGDRYQVIESLKRESERRLGQENTFTILIGQFLIVSILFFMLYLFLLNFRTEILSDDSKILFILLLISFIVILSSFVLRSNSISLYVVPFAIVPIFIRAFYDARLALFIHLVTIFLIGFFAPNGYEFVLINFIAGVVAIASLTNLYRSGNLFYTVSLVLISYLTVYLSLVIVQDGTLAAVNWFTLAWFAVNALLLLALYQLVYLIEKIFGFLSDATLIELSDTNQDLLRKLAEVAPGTFQHSLQVANLAEAATYKIGGNPLLVRAGALYHDIGKMSNPFYFIENQPTDFNPHQNIDYEESAAIIIKHITEGIQIARKNKLPDQLIDFIRMHHGTNKVKYFYRMHKDKFTETIEDDLRFSYPGPRPNSKEIVVLMMADSVEAASRSFKKITLQAIDELVDKIIDNLQAEEQFNDASITFKDITTIKSVFKRKLQNIYHSRVEYPDER